MTGAGPVNEAPVGLAAYPEDVRSRLIEIRDEIRALGGTPGVSGSLTASVEKNPPDQGLPIPLSAQRDDRRIEAPKALSERIDAYLGMLWIGSPIIAIALIATDVYLLKVLGLVFVLIAAAVSVFCLIGWVIQSIRNLGGSSSEDHARASDSDIGGE